MLVMFLFTIFFTKILAFREQFWPLFAMFCARQKLQKVSEYEKYLEKIPSTFSSLKNIFYGNPKNFETAAKTSGKNF